MGDIMKNLVNDRKDRGLETEITDGMRLLELGREWLKRGNPVVAIELLNSASESSEATRNKHLRARILKEMGRALMMQSQWNDASLHYDHAQSIFIDIDDYRGAAECIRNRANMAFQQGDYAISEQFCEQAIDLASEVGDHELRATILNTMGAIKSTLGNQQEAVKVLNLCLADFKAAGNSIRQGYVLLNIGLSRMELGEFEAASSCFNGALNIAFSEQDQNLVATCYQNKAKCYFNQKEYHLAKSVSEIARKTLPGLNSPTLILELNLIDARILIETGDINSAETLIEASFEQAVENNLSQMQADLLFEHGQLYKIKGKMELAIYKLDSALNIYRQIGMESSVQKTERELDSISKRGKA